MATIRNEYDFAVATEQSAFFEDEFYFGRIKADDLTPDDWSYIQHHSAAHYFHVPHTLPHLFH